MREVLRQINGKESQFVATVNRKGAKISRKHMKKVSFRGAKTCLSDVFVITSDGTQYVSEHLWVDTTQELAKLQTNTSISFSAIPISYLKGYQGKHRRTIKANDGGLGIDYTLDKIKNVIPQDAPTAVSVAH